MHKAEQDFREFAILLLKEKTLWENERLKFNEDLTTLRKAWEEERNLLIQGLVRLQIDYNMQIFNESTGRN
jgi:hypothetical protein